MQLGWIQGLGAGFHVPEFFDASLPSLNDVGLEPRPVSKNLAAGLQTLQGFVKVFLTFLERQGGDVAVLFWISIVTAGQNIQA